MAQEKLNNLDQIHFEGVSCNVEGLDPILSSVDMSLPMDQTVLVQASNPSHAVYFLELLAGRKTPQAGKVYWLDQHNIENIEISCPLYEVISSYFESNRPHPEVTVSELLNSLSLTPEMCSDATDFFDLHKVLNTKFGKLRYEDQKLLMLISSTLKLPQMLTLEDPAVGLSEHSFLNFLDWLQLWQRQGFMRHVYLTNNHPTAARHLMYTSLIIDEGLIYIEENLPVKKIVHF